MVRNILSISIDPALLYTRGLVLERTGAFVRSSTPEPAMALMKTCAFDVIVLCHSLPEEEAQQAYGHAHACRPGSKILVIDSPIVPLSRVKADLRVSLDDGPKYLVMAAQRLLLAMETADLHGPGPAAGESADLRYSEAIRPADHTLTRVRLAARRGDA